MVSALRGTAPPMEALDFARRLTDTGFQDKRVWSRTNGLALTCTVHLTLHPGRHTVASGVSEVCCAVALQCATSSKPQGGHIP
jgi:hypothetical protein